MPNTIKKDKQILISDIKKYIKIIKMEYKNLIKLPSHIDFDKIVHIEQTGTISLFVRNKEFYFPLDSYNVIEELKKQAQFGLQKNHSTYDKNSLIINDNTFYTYIEHLILKGCTPIEYFQEILLHETMHFCGANGSSALMEGLNEYFTRKLALKHNLLTNGCGYPKEIKIIIELEKIFGENALLQILFAPSKEEIKKILNKINPQANNFFFKLNELMEEEFYNKYYKYKFPGLTGPFEKAQKYNDINYSKAHELINNYNNLSIQQ